MNPSGAPLLPKLRGQFAEFLSKRSLERLWIFTSSTCVGLWYGHLANSLEVFPGSVKSETCRPYGHVPSLTVECPRGFAYGNRLSLVIHHVHQLHIFLLLRHPIVKRCQAGQEY